MRQTMDLLNLHQPWDCQRFPKSKTICYGGGGGGSATDVVNKVTNEAKKVAKGDVSVKKAVQGTASGAESTIKKSDLGKVVKQAADKSGYTGSDIDTGAQKIEKESSNVVNQTLDAVDNPTKVVNDAVNRAKNFGAETAGEVKDAFGAYETAGKNIETTGQNIVGAFEDTFQTGMNAASALGQNLANQLGTASGDKGGLKGKANIADLLEQKRKGRRGGLSRSGTSRTLITGKV
tara:strand:- start:145 stop:846 length:702 start_codon:yes stop_codon:yes gene_type:complete